jgi:hypothetical protein
MDIVHDYMTEFVLCFIHPFCEMVSSIMNAANVPDWKRYSVQQACFLHDFKCLMLELSDNPYTELILDLLMSVLR